MVGLCVVCLMNSQWVLYEKAINGPRWICMALWGVGILSDLFYAKPPMDAGAIVIAPTSGFTLPLQ